MMDTEARFFATDFIVDSPLGTFRRAGVLDLENLAFQAVRVDDTGEGTRIVDASGFYHVAASVEDFMAAYREYLATCI